MSTINLHRIFNPESVAVIGASEKEGSVGFSIMKNLVTSDFKGEIFPVNPKRKDIMGLGASADIQDIVSSVDMAVIATPIQMIPQIVESCGKAGLAGPPPAGPSLVPDAPKAPEGEVEPTPEG